MVVREKMNEDWGDAREVARDNGFSHYQRGPLAALV